MRVTILNGDPDPASEFRTYLSTVASCLEAEGHSVTKVDLVELDLKGCGGCFGCWVKTPGECVKGDDSAQVCRAAVNAELLLLASPLKMGFTSALLKRAADQMIPIVQPYFQFQEGAIHHQPRYAHYPKMALLLGAGTGSDAEDVQITTEIWGRTAINMQSKLVFAAVTDRAAKEIADEIAHIA